MTMHEWAIIATDCLLVIFIWIEAYTPSGPPIEQVSKNEARPRL